MSESRSGFARRIEDEFFRIRTILIIAAAAAGNGDKIDAADEAIEVAITQITEDLETLHESIHARLVAKDILLAVSDEG